MANVYASQITTYMAATVLHAAIQLFGTDGSAKATMMAASQWQTLISTLSIANVFAILAIDLFKAHVCPSMSTLTANILNPIKKEAMIVGEKAQATIKNGMTIVIGEDKDLAEEQGKVQAGTPQAQLSKQAQTTNSQTNWHQMCPLQRLTQHPHHPKVMLTICMTKMVKLFLMFPLTLSNTTLTYHLNNMLPSPKGLLEVRLSQVFPLGLTVQLVFIQLLLLSLLLSHINITVSMIIKLQDHFSHQVPPSTVGQFLSTQIPTNGKMGINEK